MLAIMPPAIALIIKLQERQNGARTLFGRLPNEVSLFPKLALEYGYFAIAQLLTMLTRRV